MAIGTMDANAPQRLARSNDVGYPREAPWSAGRQSRFAPFCASMIVHGVHAVHFVHVFSYD